MEETSKIMALHRAQREYHFGKDSVAFAHQLSDQFISVNRGSISTPKRQETISRYHGYFSSVEFIKWDDLAEPIIRFSDDGSMAYTIVDKIVVTTYEDENGDTVEGSTHFAWTAIYKKYGDEWKIDCVTSTEEPVLSK
ncbi:MAG: nuclear transport factor 2 family protein [Marinoscillum sp.]|uniref:nuclear transport factor 2 family protein n=1 Tax=Marinoscillum sp. TaxID=2024838 RepID=UPI0032F0B09F